MESGILTRGPHVGEFEALFASCVGVEDAFTTSSGTAALHLALAAGGIEPDDEVLISDFTFPATGNVVAQLGAVPVLVDCMSDQLVMDVGDLASKINRRTKAIIAVDPFGLPCRMDLIELVAKEHGLFLVEDAACALGARVADRPCGSFSDCGCFSFHPRKLVTTGEGGMITTSDQALAKRLRMLANHGGRRGAIETVFEAHGYNYRMSEIQAVLGLSQMRNLEAILGNRSRTATLYDEMLTGVPGLTLPHHATPGANMQSYVVVLDDHIDRDAIVIDLRESGIEAAAGTYALHGQPAFGRYGYRPGDLPNSWRYFRQSLVLPIHAQLTDTEITSIAQRLSRAAGE